MGAKQSQESAGPVATAQQNSNSGRSHHQHHQHRLHHSQHPLTLSHPGLVGHSSRPSSSPASVSREHHRHHSPSPQPHLSHSQRPQALSHPSPALSHPSSAHSHPHRVTSGSMLTTSYSHPSAHSQAPRSHVHVRREGERDRERRAHQPQRPDFMALDFTMPSLDQRLVPVPRSAHNIGSSSHSRGERRRRGHRLNDFHVGAISSSAPVGSLLIVRGLSRKCSKEVYVGVCHWVHPPAFPLCHSDWRWVVDQSPIKTTSHCSVASQTASYCSVIS